MWVLDIGYIKADHRNDVNRNMHGLEVSDAEIQFYLFQIEDSESGQYWLLSSFANVRTKESCQVAEIDFVSMLSAAFENLKIPNLMDSGQPDFEPVRSFRSDEGFSLASAEE